MAGAVNLAPAALRQFAENVSSMAAMLLASAEIIPLTGF
jgi:hypothetical protein